MTQRGYSDPEVDSAPLPQYVEAKEARRKANRAFIYGMAFGFAASVALMAGAAMAETITIGRNLYINGSAMEGTTVTIEPSDNPGELAVVTLRNAHVNDAGDNGERFISIPGLAVGVEFQWDAVPLIGSDRITVRPPEGIVCVPEDCAVTVPEGGTGEVVLLDWVGM